MQLINIILIGILIMITGTILYFKIQKIKKKGFGCDCGCGTCNRADCSLPSKPTGLKKE